MASIWNAHTKKFCEIDGVRVSAADRGYRCHRHLSFAGRAQYCGNCGCRLHQNHCASCGPWKPSHAPTLEETGVVREYIQAAMRGMRAYDRLVLIASKVSEATGVSIDTMRSGRSVRHVNEARRLVCAIARKYAPDLSTELIAEYLNKHPQVVTKYMRISYTLRNRVEEEHALQVIELSIQATLERISAERRV